MLRHLRRPITEHLGRRHFIERIIGLYSREARRVIGQHLGGRQVLWIEAALPLFVRIAAGPDIDAHVASLTTFERKAIHTSASVNARVAAASYVHSVTDSGSALVARNARTAAI